MEISKVPLECFRHEDLLRNSDLSDAVERAFGREGLGIAVVTGVPDIADSRHDLFHLGRRFATLPEETKARYEHPISSFSFGWSHGKEELEAGRPDLAKGSFYANPCVDAPFADDPAAVSLHPAFAHPNLWPDHDVPGFSGAFKALGQAVVRVGVLVAQQCDRYVEQVHQGYEKGKLARIVSSSRCAKGRFLHYFPQADNSAATCSSVRGGGEENKESDDSSFSDWCGWHHDHSSLTGLVPGMFLDAEGQEVDNVDPNCGLFIRSRQGTLVKASLPPGVLPPSCLLFQIGETTQVHSGGALQATPHAVRSSSRSDVSREAFAVFMQPEWGESMDVPRGTDVCSTRSLHTASLLPRQAAQIDARLRPGMDFGAFTAATLASFY